MLLPVIDRVIVPCSFDSCWKYVSEPRMISEWFADTDQLRLNQPVQFAFGDGDYFAGTILALEEPTFLRLEWKFMGLGGQSDISLFLCPLEDQTEVTVVDRGEYTAREAEELREGWRDFFSRLEQRIATGENSRYRWSPDIRMAAVVQCDHLSIVRILRDVFWWREAFPHTSPVTLQPGRGEEVVQAIFEEAEWSGRQTKATVEISSKPDGWGITVSHTGWADLPLDLQLDARRRWASLWQHALLELEHRFRVGGKCNPHVFALWPD